MATPDILITPGAGTMAFTGSVTGTMQLRVAESGALHFEGDQGSLLTITDDLSDSLFSVNDAAGMPVFEVFADDTIKSYRNNESKLEIDPDNNRIRLRDNTYISGDLIVSGDITSTSASHESTSYTASTHVSGLSGYYGKVGIGTTQNKFNSTLVIHNEVGENALVITEQDSDTRDAIIMTANADRGWMALKNATNSRIVFSAGGTSWIDEGPFYVGTTSAPGSLFAVDGDASITGALTAAGQIRTAGGALATPSFGFTDDAGLGMSRPTTQALNFITSSAEHMRIDSDGKVAIGTTAADGSKLRVNGDVGISGQLSMRGAGVANVPALAIDTTNAATFIHSAEAFAGSMTAGQSNIIVVGKEGTSKNAGYIGYEYQGAGSDANTLILGHWGSNYLVNIKGDGSVGIGTTNPDALLELYSSAPFMRIKDGGVYPTNANPYILFDDYNASIGAVGVLTPDGHMDLWAVSGDVRIAAQNAEAVRIKAGGNVGIGTVAPTGSRLEVSENFGTTAGVTKLRITARTQGAYDGDAHLEFAYNDWGNLNIPNHLASIQGLASVAAPTNVGGELAFATKALGSTPSAVPVVNMRIKPDGKVGIGVTSPQSLLVVNGDAGITGELRVNSHAVLPDGYAYKWGAGDTWIQGSSAADEIKLITNSSPRFAVDNNVTQVTGQLRVNSTSSFAGDVYLKESTPILYFQDTDTAQIASIRHIPSTTRLGIFGDSSTELFSVQTEGGTTAGDTFISGYVGIGSDPGSSYKLNLKQNEIADNRTIAKFEGVANSSTTTGGGQYLSVMRGGPIGGASNNTAGGILLGISPLITQSNCGIRGTYEYTNGRDLQFFTSADNSSGPYNRMSIKGDGKVGIGTQGVIRDPDGSLLRVGGDVGITGELKVNEAIRCIKGTSQIALNEFNNGATIWLDGVNGDLMGGDYYNISAVDGGGSLQFGYGTATKMTMTSAGNVTIVGDLMVGNTVLNPVNGHADQVGLGFDASAGALQVASAVGSIPLQLGRITAAGDGDMISLRCASNYFGGISFDSDGGNYGNLDIEATGKLQLQQDGGSVGVGCVPSSTVILDVRDKTDRNTRMQLINPYQTTDGRETAIWFGRDNGAGSCAELKYRHDTSPDDCRIELNHYSSGQQFVLMQGGNIGIGTDNPGSLLHLRAATPTIRFEDTTNGVLGYVGDASDFLPDGPSGPDTFGLRADGAMTFGTNGNVFRAIIGNDGVVGIATAIPTGKLHVYQSGDAYPAFLVEGSQGSLFSVEDSLTGSLMSVNDIAGLPVFEAFDDGTIVMGQYNSGDFIVTGNKVGIGMASEAPSYNLHIKPVNGNARFKLESDNNAADVEMMLDSASSTRNAHITFYNAGTQKGGVGYVASDTCMKMWGDNNPADDHLVIKSNGSIGIGTTDVAGSNLRVKDNVGISGELRVLGHVRPNGIVMSATRTAGAGVGGSVADENSFEIGPGYVNFNRDDTAVARQIQFGKNGSLHSAIETSTSGLAFLGSDGQGDMIIKTDGTVGIGTASPAEKLDIQSSSDPTIKMKRTAGAQVVGLKFYNEHNTMISRIGTNIAAPAGLENGIDFYVGNPAQHPNMTLAGNGNLGIGDFRAAAPQALLTVSGSASISGQLRVNHATAGSFIVAGGGDNARFGDTSDGVVIGDAAGVGYLQGTDINGSAYNALGFKTSANYAMYINTSSNVGIGTVVPATTLDINGVTTIRDYIKIGAAGVQGVLTWNGGAANTVNLHAAAGKNLSLGAGGGAAENIFIAANGNVGIGFSTSYGGSIAPSGRFHVNNAGTGIIVANDHITGNAFEVHGAQGNLLTITDDLSDSLMSVNDAAGMPVFEVFADDTIKSYRNNESKFEVDPDNNRIRLRDHAFISGDLTISGDADGVVIDARRDTDSSAEIGKAHIGSMGHADYAGFSHVDSNAVNDYCVLQAHDGTSFLNATNGTSVNIRIGNGANLQHVITAGTTEFNADSDDNDFVVQGDVVDNQLYVDAATHSVGIGASADSVAKMRIMATATNGSTSTSRPFINFTNGNNNNHTNIDTTSTASSDHAHAGWLLVAVNGTSYYLQLYAS